MRVKTKDGKDFDRQRMLHMKLHPGVPYDPEDYERNRPRNQSEKETLQRWEDERGGKKIGDI